MRKIEPLQIYRHFKGRMYEIICVAIDSEDGRPQVVYRALYEPYTIYTRDMEMFLSPVDRKKYPMARQHYRFELCEFDNQPQVAVQPERSSVFTPKKSTSDELSLKEPPRAAERVPAERVSVERAHGERVPAERTFGREHESLGEKTDLRASLKQGGMADDIVAGQSRAYEEKRTDAATNVRSESPVPDTKPVSKPASKPAINPYLERFLDARGYEQQLECLSVIKEYLTPEILTPIEFSIGMEEAQKGNVMDRYRGIKNYIMLKQRYEKSHR